MNSTDTEYLKETFQYSVDTYNNSQVEAQEVRDMYSNRQYTAEQIEVLNSRGQPVETFNVVLMMSRALMGFLGKVQNRPQIKARTISSNDVASALNDYSNYVLDDNEFDSVKRKIQLDGILSGLMVEYVDIQKTGQKDQYGRDINRISLEYVPSWQVAKDPMSKLDDGSDFRFFHRFKWISEDNFIALYGKRKLKDLEANTNYLNRDLSHMIKFLSKEFATYGNVEGSRVIFVGKFKNRIVNERTQQYIKEYVICKKCGSPDTKIEKEDRVMFLHCMACQARYPIRKVK
jgi:translation initiation factor 2 subunit 2